MPSYTEAIDDNPLIGTDVDKAYLDIAIEQMLANKKIEIPDTTVRQDAPFKKLK